jgi:F0F1-type ATP synthase assembly protein I
MALNMSWQLAIVVLVPVIGGVALDKHFGTSAAFTLIGLALALLLSGVVMWRTMQVANQLPVPKLSAAQKKAIKKSYDEDDD